jgi:hypothetical protein
MNAFLLFTSMAFASPFDDTLNSAQDAILSENYEQVFELLDGAERGFERSVTIIQAESIANVFMFRGLAAHLNGGDGIPHFRSALMVYPYMEWDTELSNDDLAQDIFAQIKKEIESRNRISPGIPEQTGLAQIYIDGKQRKSGETIISGVHLAQIKCPKGDVYGKWTDFKRPVKWLKMCPYRVDPTEVPPVVENEWASLIPSGGGIPSIPSIPTIPGASPMGAPTEETDIVVLSAWERVNKPYLATAAALATVSGVSYFLSSQSYNQYVNVDNNAVQTVEDLNTLQSKTNRRMLTSVTFGLGASVMYSAALWRVKR